MMTFVMGFMTLTPVLCTTLTFVRISLPATSLTC